MYLTPLKSDSLSFVCSFDKKIENRFKVKDINCLLLNVSWVEKTVKSIRYSTVFYGGLFISSPAFLPALTKFSRQKYMLMQTQLYIELSSKYMVERVAF